MFYITAILTGVSSYFLSSIFKKGIYFLLIFFALVIFNMELLSLFKSIAGINIFILTLVETIVVLLIWNKKERPVLKIDINSFVQKIKQASIEDKYFKLPVFAWFVLITVTFVIVLFYPPTEGDALSYHCVRALFWVRDGFINHFPINDIRAHIMPINSELYYTWLLALMKKDLYFGSLSYFSYFLLLFSSYKVMEHIGIAFANRIWALLIFSSFPAIICQMPSTQTDLCVGALITLSIALVFDYKKENKLSTLYFAALAFAIALGVKTTTFMAGAPVLIWFIFLLRKNIFKFAGFLILNFIVFSSYNYILNFVEYGNFIGSTGAYISHKCWGGYKGIIANYIRYILNFIDFTGFKLAFLMRDNFLIITNNVFNFIHIDPKLGVNIPRDYLPVQMIEQVAGFGILGLFWFLPAIIICFFKKNLRIFSILFASMLLILSASMAYMIYSMRFMCAFAAIAIPVLSVLYFKSDKNLVKILAIIFMIYHMGFCCFKLNERPFAYLAGELFKNKNLYETRNNLRNVKFMFKDEFNQPYKIRLDIEANSKDSDKIAIFMDYEFMLYDIKYLEIKGHRKIDFLNPLYISKYDLSQYALIYVQTSITGDVFHKEDYGESDYCTSINAKKEILNGIYPGSKKYFCELQPRHFANKGFIKDGTLFLNAIPYGRGVTRNLIRLRNIR